MTIKTTLAVLALSILSLTACKKDSDSTTIEEPDFEQVSQYVKKYKNGVIEVTQLPGDTVNLRAATYFNFDKIAFAGSDKAQTKEWHLAFLSASAGALYPNNGKMGTEEDAWNGNSSNIMLANIAKPFDEVQAVPADLVFGTDENQNIVGIAGTKDDRTTNSPLFWAYSLNDVDGIFLNFVPFTNKTTIFKLEDGRYVKFQMINCYNNTPGKNGPKSRPGYFSFRYFISKAGSTDIKTN